MELHKSAVFRVEKHGNTGKWFPIPMFVFSRASYSDKSSSLSRDEPKRIKFLVTNVAS